MTNPIVLPDTKSKFLAKLEELTIQNNTFRYRISYVQWKNTSPKWSIIHLGIFYPFPSKDQAEEALNFIIENNFSMKDRIYSGESEDWEEIPEPE